MHTRKLARLVTTVVQDPQLHARWLNTFSFLEYIGFRKIVKSQAAEQVDADTLRHALEEGRHALRLKKFAVKLGGPKFETYSPEFMLAGDAAAAYFKRLDEDCETELRHFEPPSRSKLVYLYVTWIVENRALEVYAAYEAALKVARIDLSLDWLLKEEAGHLDQVHATLAAIDPHFTLRRIKLKGIESELYADYLEALEKALAPRLATAHADAR